LTRDCDRPRAIGVCIWFTGLSGSGKSTTADAVATSLIRCGRTVTVLDGDVVRTHLSAGLGFRKDDRDANIRRIGFVASEIVRHGGVVICAAISPYRATREECRAMIGTDHFVEVFVDTPLAVCERRDPKGLYARARRGEIPHFTGLDDPYEPPLHPDVTLDTIAHTAEDNVRTILSRLAQMGFALDESAYGVASSSR
jgi:sulfate adenylyltransferase